MTHLVVPKTSESEKTRSAGRISEEVLGGSEQTGDVFAHLVLPIRPVVAAFGAPVVQRMANAFGGEDFGEAVGGAGIFPLAGAGGDVNIAGGELAEEPGIAQVSEVVDGIVEIKIVVVHPVHEIFQ